MGIVIQELDSKVPWEMDKVPLELRDKSPNKIGKDLNILMQEFPEKSASTFSWGLKVHGN